MKKLLILTFALVFVLGMLGGCGAKQSQAENAVEPDAVTGAKVEQSVDSTEPADDEVVDDVETTQPSDTEPNVLWTAINYIEFELSGNTYKVGEVCSAITEDFEVVEIVDGRLNEEDKVYVGEKVTLKVSDGTNEFLVVIRNNNNQNAAISDCTLHEILFEAATFDMSSLRIHNVIDGDATVDEWVAALGSEYTDYSSDSTTCYYWKVNTNCYVDVYFDNAGNAETVQMMVY